MAVEGVKYFQFLFKAKTRGTIAKMIRLSNSFLRFVNLKDNQALMTKVGKEEFLLILQSFQKDKSRNFDGLSVNFYLGCYDFIEEDLRRFIESSRTTGKTLASFNTTFIALIPKLDNTTCFENFQPISVRNCIYKIISKSIVRRMKGTLFRRISSEKFGFFGGVANSRDIRGCARRFTLN